MTWLEHDSGTHRELPVELIEKLRAQLHATVDRRIDALLSGQTSREANLNLPLDKHPSVFKGKRPLSVSFPNGRTVETLTWKKVASAVLNDCNSDPVRRGFLSRCRGKAQRAVFGLLTPFEKRTR